MFIRSERLFLRPGWPEDSAELRSLMCDAQIVRNLANAPWPDRAEEIRSGAAPLQDRRFPQFFVTVPGAQGSRLVGACGIAPSHGADPELGFWIARSDWGKGYATEAGRAVLRLASTLGHRRIVAHQFADHPASDRVLRKLGFSPSGEINHRYCTARGQMAPAIVYAQTLGSAGDCDNGTGVGAGGDPDAGDAERMGSGMRAA